MHTRSLCFWSKGINPGLIFESAVTIPMKLNTGFLPADIHNTGSKLILIHIPLSPRLATKYFACKNKPCNWGICCLLPYAEMDRYSIHPETETGQ